MGLATDLYRKKAKKWKRKRFETFVSKLLPRENEYVIDLGGSRGDFFHNNQDLIDKYNLKIVIADIDEGALAVARSRGFETLHISERGFQDFADDEFDIVFCNSVIEHVTVVKDEVWDFRSQEFFAESFKIQQAFAQAIERVAKKYFVQTPHVDFPIESHAWFPKAYIYTQNRGRNIDRLRKLNSFWVKKTKPDYNLLNEDQMRTIFPEATDVLVNTVCLFPKEIIAYKA